MWCNVRGEVPIYAKRLHHRRSSFIRQFLHKNNDELDKKHSYWHQVQGQLHLCQKAVCNFVDWRTKETLILEIKKDPAWDDNLCHLQDFYMTYNHSIHY